MTQGTMELIQTVTVPAGGQAAIEFTNIAQTYDDLKIVISGRSSSTPAEGMYIAFNGSTSNFTGRYLIGDGTNASSGVLARYVGSIFGAVGTASTFNNTEIYIPNYRTSANKSFSVDNVAENNATTGFQNLIAGLWSDSSAITSISITCAGFLQHSTATLYGITRVPAGAKATGGVIYDDSSFWYHVFTSSGTFTPSQNLTCDYLVVAGGGGGVGNRGGGGGAGGLRSTVTATGGGGSLESALSLTGSTSYTVTIGAGGTVSGLNTPTNGSDSSFSSITSTGGGRGGLWFANPGATGGSGGGGAGSDFQGNGAGGAGTANQGFAGGSGLQGANDAASGGGGGAGAVGQAGQSSKFGDGGIGVQITALATPTSTGANGGYYAGGGGGGGDLRGGNTKGFGGLGGGADSAANGVNAVAALQNTGGGGGGGAYTFSGGDIFYSASNGGSGIVIVRYAK